MLDRFISLFGVAVFIALGWLLSHNRRAFPWRTVLAGMALQFVFAFLILRTSAGMHLFEGAKDAVARLNDFAIEGAKMVFGPLADEAKLKGAFQSGPIFAILISATIIVISSLSALLYHWGVLQRVVAGLAWVMMRVMGTSGSESLAAASNIFLGQTEAALVIKPYLAKMTRSEIMALMVPGFSTIATGVMVIYASLPMMSAGHIFTASVLGAPAGLLMAKVMFPETEQSETGRRHHFQTQRTAVNSIDALCTGAGEGVTLSLNIIGMLLAFVAVVALLNALIAWPQQAAGVASPVTLQQALGWLNTPFAWLIGVPRQDCGFIGQILGERIVLNEFIGYIHLSEYAAANPGALAPRSITLASYALCGFANFASIAVQIGGIGALCPERRADLARLGLRAMIGGVLACYIIAAVVGVIA
ncbi:MAG TPA: nucleoside transporter C-terminal domain-containing protein [Chthoniobacteraceae bacterium]|jgi:CNT family concentrative nucleoside transporter|nr:nucleoside transporter C-terminal domain-containing protein [Chthoniobacteraceae bacterium]